MANRKLANSFLNISIENQSSEVSNFPAVNIMDRSSPQKQWRSTSTAEQTIDIDLGSDQTTLTTYIDWTNVPEIKYQESSTNLAAGPYVDLSSSLTSVEKDPVQGVYRRKDELTLSSKRYLRILMTGAQTPTDGATYYRIGTLAIPTNIVELDADTTVEYPYDVTLPSSHIIENRFPTGKTEKVKLGRLQPMVISFALRTGVRQNIKGDGVQEITDLLRDPTDTIFLDFNLGESWQAYLVKKSGDLRASLSSPATGTADFGSVLFDVIT